MGVSCHPNLLKFNPFRLSKFYALPTFISRKMALAGKTVGLFASLRGDLPFSSKLEDDSRRTSGVDGPKQSTNAILPLTPVRS